MGWIKTFYSYCCRTSVTQNSWTSARTCLRAQATPSCTASTPFWFTLATVVTPDTITAMSRWDWYFGFLRSLCNFTKGWFPGLCVFAIVAGFGNVCCFSLLFFISFICFIRLWLLSHRRATDSGTKWTTPWCTRATSKWSWTNRLMFFSTWGETAGGAANKNPKDEACSCSLNNHREDERR